jgi:hypothetical protein
LRSLAFLLPFLASILDCVKYEDEVVMVILTQVTYLHMAASERLTVVRCIVGKFGLDGLVHGIHRALDLV